MKKREQKRKCIHISIDSSYLCTDFGRVFRAESGTKLKTFWKLPVIHPKYSPKGLFILLFFLQGILWSGCGRMNFPGRTASSEGSVGDSSAVASTVISEVSPTVVPSGPEPVVLLPDTTSPAGLPAQSNATSPSPADVPAQAGQSAAKPAATPAESMLSQGTFPMAAPDSSSRDSLAVLPDSIPADSLLSDTLLVDSTKRYKYGKPYFDEIITEKNKDSLIFDVRNNKVYIYNAVETQYTDKTLKADYMVMTMDDKMIYAQGVADSAGKVSRPIFLDGPHEYYLDSILYNLDSKKAKIRNVWTREGDGYLTGTIAKKMPDNTSYFSHMTYTTCNAPHPHFYIRIYKGKLIPGNKTIFQRADLVIEDVPLPFALIPFGFFPMASEKSSGFIMPTFGEQYSKGFFLRNGGYYFLINDYIDLTVTGGYYTLGSWEANVGARYRKRYRYNGGFNFSYSNNKFGDRGSTDWSDAVTYNVTWNHTQDPKFKPGQTFSASVNFSSSQYNRYSPTTINDFAVNQTNSSVSFSKNWTRTPFSMSASMRHSQINRDTTVSLSFPNVAINMSRVNPFKFKNRKPGPERWYEKIYTTYSGNLANSVSNVKEYNLFKQAMFDQMSTSMQHSLPVTANFNLFNYITVSPSFSYSESWNTRKYERNWDDLAQKVVTDTVHGFYRAYRYSGSVSANTTIYGMFEFNPRAKIEAIRHTLNPRIGFSFTPDFGSDKFGFYSPYQTNKDGDIGYYSPYVGAPGRGASRSLTFGLDQSLEARVKSKKDSIGTRKVKIIDQLSFSFNYNFMADSMKLSRSIPFTFRSTLIPGFNLNLGTTLGMYAFENGREVDKLLISQGKAPRIESLSFSTNWGKSWGQGANNAQNNNIDQSIVPYTDPFNPTETDPDLGLEELEEMEARAEEARLSAYRGLLANQYYDFNVPLSVNINYSIHYSNDGREKKIIQAIGFSGSLNLTPNWGLAFSSGYDMEARKLVETTNFSLHRDLHCMEMSFNWAPLGSMKSWNFRIAVKANILQDMKYEKSGSRFDN